MATIDTVQIGALFSGAPDTADVDAAIWDGLRRTGSILIDGFPDQADIDRRARTGLAVFDLADTVQAAVTSRLFAPGNSTYYRGFWPSRTNTFLKNDFFDVGPTHPQPGPDLPGMDILTEQTPWPDPPPSPDWIGCVKAHYAHLNAVALAVILSIGRSAGFAEPDIRARFGGAHSTLRFLNYAAGAQSAFQDRSGVKLSGGRHTDASGLSLLWQSSPGLQAEGPDGVFRDVPAVPNGISIHVGDVMTRLTDGAVPATPHRVLSTDRPRQSVGFFLEPALNAPVTPVTQADWGIEDTYAWQLLSTFASRPVWSGVIPHPGQALRRP